MTTRRLRTIAAALFAGTIVFGAGWWAGGVALTQPKTLPSSAQYTLVSAQRGEIGQRIRLNASAEWKVAERPRVAAQGVVTAMSRESGSVVKPGDRLLEVDLTPVFAAVGSVPAFRDLGEGDTGDDVRQVEGMLKESGFPVATDGKYSRSDSDAVRRWQRAKGVPATGRIRAQDVVWFDELPARISWGGDIRVGEPISPSTSVIARLAASPSFWLVAGEDQARLLGAGMEVSIQAGDDQWPAVIGAVTSETDPATGHQQAKATLEPPSGKSICGKSCSKVPAGGQSTFPATITTVAVTRGVWVPTAALATDAEGRVGVVGTNGEFRPVTVVQSAQGRSIVEDLDEGFAMRVPGDGKSQGS